jgi:hypothetical protein
LFWVLGCQVIICKTWLLLCTGCTLQTCYLLWSTVRFSVPLTNMLPTMVHSQVFCTSNKHVTYYGPQSGFLYL